MPERGGDHELDGDFLSSASFIFTSSHSLAVVGVIQGKVLSDDRAAGGRHDLTDSLVHRVRPDIPIGI